MSGTGEILLSTGSIDAPVFLRSTAKPFIAAAIVAAGAAERFGLEPHEIAVMSASHTGQAFHIEAVRSILKKIGLGEDALQCGVQAPSNAQALEALQEEGIAPSAVYNNCSGKHAGILALCLLTGADTGTYLRPENPAQKAILALCARLSDESEGSMPLAIDGCGIPVYATPLRNAALSFARFATLQGIRDADARALQVVRDAMIANPQYVSGTGEFDTRLMQETHGAIACKGGAEGVHGVAAVNRGGMVLKVRDGASRGRAPASLAIIGKLKWIGDAAAAALAEFSNPPLYNRAGTRVGEVVAVV